MNFFVRFKAFISNNTIQYYKIINLVWGKFLFFSLLKWSSLVFKRKIFSSKIDYFKKCRTINVLNLKFVLCSFLFVFVGWYQIVVWACWKNYDITVYIITSETLKTVWNLYIALLGIFFHLKPKLFIPVGSCTKNWFLEYLPTALFS